jgi:DNA-directed RNA polymerase subunit H
MPGEIRSDAQGGPPLRFNVLEHQLVPEHRLVPEEETDRILKALKITRDQLPKIRKSDPVIQVLEKIEGPIPEGRIIRVTRVSGTAGVSEAYRLVIGR